MADPAQLPDKKDGDNYIVLLLSLNLILLAFFILLNALSNFEPKKTNAALHSVNRAFRGLIETPRDATSASASLGVLPLPQDLTNKIGSLFESFVPSARIKHTARSTVMTVAMPADELFRAGTHDIRPERRVLIRRLARALMRDPDGAMKFELAFEHGTADAATQSADTQDAELSARRGDTMARYLIRQSIPYTALAIGSRPGVGDTVWFVLRMRTDAVPLAESSDTTQPLATPRAGKPVSRRVEP